METIYHNCGRCVTIPCGYPKFVFSTFIKKIAVKTHNL